MIASSTLTVSFTPPATAPALGYVVLYRPVGSSAYTQVGPNPTTGPVVIPVTPGIDYEGTIQSECSSTFFSTPPTPFTAVAPSGVMSVSVAYGMTVTGISGTAIPAISYPVSSGTATANFKGTIPVQSIQVTLSGTPVTTSKIDLYVNSVLMSCTNITGAGTYYLNISTAISSPTTFMVAIDSGTC